MAKQVELWLPYVAWLGALATGAVALVGLYHLYGRRLPSKLDGRAGRDARTGLLNRDGLVERLSVMVNQAEATGNGLSVLLLGLDDFRAVNKAHGTLAGDQILVGCAARMQLATSGLCELARLSGDKFVALVPHENPDELESLARRITQAFERPIESPTALVSLTVSIGMARYRHDRLHRRTLLLAADIALTAAKHAGKNTWRSYSAVRQRNRGRRSARPQGISATLPGGQLKLLYQRKVALSSGKVVGYEALLRQQTLHGLRGATEVLSEAARSGLSIAINEWVVRAAARQSREWRRAGFVCPIAVNVSGIQMRDRRLVRLMNELVADDPGLPELLALELPESSLAPESGDELANAKELSHLGFAIHICPSDAAFPDASRFSHLPVSAVKMGRSLVGKVPASAESRETIEWVVSLASSLGMKVVAEGVETEEQMQFLRSCGCQEAQGYFFDHPMPAEEVIRRSFFTAEG